MLRNAASKLRLPPQLLCPSSLPLTRLCPASAPFRPALSPPLQCTSSTRACQRGLSHGLLTQPSQHFSSSGTSPRDTSSSRIASRGISSCGIPPCEISRPLSSTKRNTLSPEHPGPLGHTLSTLSRSNPDTISPLSRSNPDTIYPLARSISCSASMGSSTTGVPPSGTTDVGKLTPASIEISKDGKIRLATFLRPNSGGASVGVVKDGKLWAVEECSPIKGNPGMVDVITAWPDISSKLQLDPSAGIGVDSVEFLAPIPTPAGPIMCIGKNYVEHVKEVDTWKTAPHITEPSIPQHPIVFTKAPQSVVGPGSDILLPPPHVSSKVDYEAELAVIIGKEGKGISESNAMDYVFGYTNLNDVTARDVQKLHQQWFLGKSCDTFCPMGPWIVPATEVDGRDLAIQCWVNDELRQNGRTSQLIFSIPVLIATISKAMTLRPGDIIATGTPSGVGSGFNPPKLLKWGDVVRISIEGLGELVNIVK